MAGTRLAATIRTSSSSLHRRSRPTPDAHHSGKLSCKPSQWLTAPGAWAGTTELPQSVTDPELDIRGERRVNASLSRPVAVSPHRARCACYRRPPPPPPPPSRCCPSCCCPSCCCSSWRIVSASLVGELEHAAALIVGLGRDVAAARGEPRHGARQNQAAEEPSIPMHGASPFSWGLTGAPYRSARRATSCPSVTASGLDEYYLS